MHQFTIHRIALLVSTHDVNKVSPFRCMFSCVRSTSPDSCVFVARLLCSRFCVSLVLDLGAALHTCDAGVHAAADTTRR